MANKEIVLESIKPFESSHMPRSFKSWLKIYMSVLALIFVLFHMIESRAIGEAGIVIAFFLAIVFGVIILISRIKNRGNVNKAVDEICSMKFKLPDTATADEVYSKIESKLSEVYYENLTCDGNKVIVTCEKIDYEIILNGDGTFSVIAKSISPPDKTFYNKIREMTPIIAFWLQQAFDVK